MPRQTSDDAHWTAAIDDFRSSGLTQPEFCRRRGLALHTFRRRLYARPTTAIPQVARPVPAATVSPDTPRFLPVILVADPITLTASAAPADSLVLILDARRWIAYARSNWAALTRYLESPYLSIDNNLVENAIRPIALGRRNWLDLGSDRGGRTAATLLSLVQSCKLLSNEPFAYLRDVLDRVSNHPASRIGGLLPDRRALPGAAPLGQRAEARAVDSQDRA